MGERPQLMKMCNSLNKCGCRAWSGRGGESYTWQLPLNQLRVQVWYGEWACSINAQNERRKMKGRRKRFVWDSTLKRHTFQRRHGLCFIHSLKQYVACINDVPATDLSTRDMTYRFLRVSRLQTTLTQPKETSNRTPILPGHMFTQVQDCLSQLPCSQVCKWKYILLIRTRGGTHVELRKLGSYRDRESIPVTPLSHLPVDGRTDLTARVRVPT